MKAQRAIPPDPQLEMEVDDPVQAAKERARERDQQALLFERLLTACRAVSHELTAEHCAKELDAIWGDRGRPVSAAVLRAALADSRGNYFRAEWLIWFAQQSEAVADLLLEAGGRGKPKKKPEDELRDLKALMRRKLGTVANELIHKAETS